MLSEPLGKIEVNSGKTEFKAAEPRDTELLSLHLIEFYKESLGQIPEIGVVTHQIKTYIDQEKLWVLKSNKQIMSFAGFTRETPNTLSLNILYTPPAFRNSGFASVVLKKMAELCFFRFKKDFMLLFVDNTNAKNLHFYKTRNFELLDKWYSIRSATNV